MAEAVFQHLLETTDLTNEWFVDSAAVCDYHAGKSPDKRTMLVLAEHGIDTYVHRARQVTGNDFLSFDYIMGMDDSNIAELESMCSLAVNGRAKCKIELLGKYDPQGNVIVPDPYYEDDIKAFEESELMPPLDHHVMYLILRRDLLEKMKWSIGALISQGAHAATACIWKFRDDPDVVAYLKDLEHMRKVTLEVNDENELLEVTKVLDDNNVDYCTWIEDNMPVCIAVKPQRKSVVAKHLRNFRLFA